jgi:TRAP-type C4-dicarboxylate transport system substrate-binding protein
MAYAEVYTGLQTGAIDGQDNPLPNVQNMKFYEVMSQIVLTSHLVGFDLLTISLDAWNGLTPEQQETLQTAADNAIDWSQAEHVKQEEELAAYFEEQGLEVYEPNLDAFREYAQNLYLESSLAESWPEGMVETINGM